MAGTAGGTTAERRRVTSRNSSSEREPPYLHLPVTASVRFGVSAVMITLVWGWLSLLPVP